MSIGKLRQINLKGSNLKVQVLYNKEDEDARFSATIFKVITEEISPDTKVETMYNTYVKSILEIGFGPDDSQVLNIIRSANNLIALSGDTRYFHNRTHLPLLAYDLAATYATTFTIMPIIPEQLIVPDLFAVWCKPLDFLDGAYAKGWMLSEGKYYEYVKNRDRNCLSTYADKYKAQENQQNRKDNDGKPSVVSSISDRC